MTEFLKPAFNFVNLQHPDDLKDGETQLRIRRLAMTKVARARRKPKTRRERNEVVLEFRKVVQRQPSLGRLNSSCVDPFSRYPIELDHESRGLLANIFSPGTTHARYLRGSWFLVGLGSPAAFHHILANSQNFLFEKVHGHFPSQDSAQALAHHYKALRLANELMGDYSKHRSNELIGTIVSFTCHHALLGNFAGNEWQKHQDALLKIIELRGGYDTIDQEHLRITVSWGDLMGSFAQDIIPSVPLPRQWETCFRSASGPHQPPNPISLAWKQQMPMRTDWITIFDDIIYLTSFDRIFDERQLELASTSGSWIEPIVFRLLAIRPLHRGTARENVIEEACRLGTLLFLAPVWRALGNSPVWTALVSRKLQSILSQYTTEWNDLNPLLVWILYSAAVETADLTERSHFVVMLAMLMNSMQIQDWSGLLQVVKSVLWVDTVFARGDDLIQDEAMQIVGSVLSGSIGRYEELSEAMEEP